MLRLMIALLFTAGWAGAAPPAEPQVRIIFVGDVMLDTLPGKAVAAGRDIFAPFREIFGAADITVANLECAVGTSGRPIEDKPFTFQAPPAVVPLLARTFSAVSLANNHSGDFGKGAFVETIDLLKAGGVAYFGGGRNLAEAHRPLILERNGLRVALLGYNEFHPREFEAGPAPPGVAWGVDAQAVADIAAARRAGADFVIPYLHWGWEQYPKPNRRQRGFARKLIRAGADAVIGNHPHVTQGTDVYRDRLIVYSLGNFVFDGFKPGPSRTGWLLELTLAKTGTTWRTVTVNIDDEGLPHPDLSASGIPRHIPRRVAGLRQ